MLKKIDDLSLPFLEVQVASGDRTYRIQLERDTFPDLTEEDGKNHVMVYAKVSVSWDESVHTCWTAEWTDSLGGIEYGRVSSDGERTYVLANLDEVASQALDLMSHALGISVHIRSLEILKAV